MLRVKTFFAIIALMLCAFAAQAQPDSIANPLSYKRSSLTLILVSHDKGTFSDEIREEFLKMPTPDRYNGLPIDTKVFVTKSGKDLKQADVSKLLADNSIGREMVGKWFDFNPSAGTMDMDFVHERGGYSAGYALFRKAESTERGMALLSDSGIDLLNNSFVLVCDMDYYNKENTGKAISALLAVGAAALSIYAGTTSDRSAASLARAGSAAAAAGALVAADIGGFSVKLHAFLYRLRWNDAVQGKFFEDYWVDSSMNDEERKARAAAFASDKSTFTLDLVGEYREKTGKTVFKSANDMHKVIREVCGNTLSAGVKTLAGSNEAFKPKSTFYCQGDTVFSYIGKKEGVTKNGRYEVVSITRKGKNNFSYQRQATLRPDQIWDNRNFNFATDSLAGVKGTSFRRETGQGVALSDMGYTLREYTPVPVSTFLMFNYATTGNNAFGGMVGVSGSWGGYCRLLVNDGDAIVNVSGGVMARLSPALYLYGGSGYGWGDQYRTKGLGGPTADVGVMYRAGAFCISAGYTGTFIKDYTTHSITLGIGFAIGKYK